MTAPAEPPPPISPAKLALRWLGLVVTVASCLYVARQLWVQNDLLRGLEWSGPVWVALGISTVLWVGVNLCVGLGWRPMLIWAGGNVSVRQSIELSWRTQVAKYLPGNVFHIAGRVWLARDYGIGAAQAGFATLLESLCLVGLAVAIGLPLLLAAPGAGVAVSLSLVAMGAVVLAMSARVRAVLQARFGLALRPEPAVAVACLARAGLGYLWVLVLQAGMFILIAHAVLPNFGWSIYHSLQAVSVSWVAGFVVVGSPGGLGVREVVFGWFADGAVSQAQLLLVAALMRGCSILGDLVCLGLGTALRSRSGNEAR